MYLIESVVQPSHQKDKWMDEMVDEMESLKKKHTWEIVQFPKRKMFIHCKWVFKRKPPVIEKEGEKFEARLVGKEYSQ